MKTINESGIKTTARRTPRAVTDASIALRTLLDGNRVSRSKVFRVVFRDSDGAIGRRDFTTHWIHRYPAKMFHRIPRAILQSLPTTGPVTLLDPFCGSGTVLLEGVLLGHRAIGVDINPMARLISSVKTTPIAASDLRGHVPGILRRAQASTCTVEDSLPYWFKPVAIRTLKHLLKSIRQIKHPSCRAFFIVCLSACVRHCSLADPSIAPPVRLSRKRLPVANEKYRKAFLHSQALKGEDIFRVFEKVVASNIRRMEEFASTPNLGSAEILAEDREACRTGLAAGSVDLVVTSPPYCGAQKYARSLSLEMRVLGISQEEIAAVDLRTLGTERVRKADFGAELEITSRSVAFLIDQVRERNPIRAHMLTIYVNYLSTFASELYRILKPGANAFVTFGTDHLAGIRIDIADIFARIAKRESLTHVATMIDTIPSRGMITVRHSTARTIPDERVVWLRREG